MDDPIGGHPTRAEQLDVLVSCVAATARPDDTVLDVGCGTGYLAHLLLEKRPDLRYCGVDLNEASLAEGRGRFAGLGDRVSFVRGDLQRVDNISLPHSALTCRFAVTVLTFHDLSADEKPAVLGWMLRHVADDGYLLLFDRLRLVAPSLFPVQRAVWDRVEAVHGRPMRSADSYDEYEADLGSGNNPGSLVRPPPPALVPTVAAAASPGCAQAEYGQWFGELGCESQLVHLHGNVALMAAARTPDGARM